MIPLPAHQQPSLAGNRVNDLSLSVSLQQVLFCGEEFPGAYQYTKAAMEPMSNVEVRVLCDQ